MKHADTAHLNTHLGVDDIHGLISDRLIFIACAQVKPSLFTRIVLDSSLEI